MLNSDAEMLKGKMGNAWPDCTCFQSNEGISMMLSNAKTMCDGVLELMEKEAGVCLPAQNHFVLLTAAILTVEIASNRRLKEAEELPARFHPLDSDPVIEMGKLINQQAYVIEDYAAENAQYIADNIVKVVDILQRQTRLGMSREVPGVDPVRREEHD